MANITTLKNLNYRLTGTQCSTYGKNLVSCIDTISTDGGVTTHHIETSTTDYYNEITISFFQLSSELTQYLNSGGVLDELIFTPTIVSLSGVGVSLSDLTEITLAGVELASFADMAGLILGPSLLTGYEVYDLFNELGYVIGGTLIDVLEKDIVVFDNHKLIKVGTLYYIMSLTKSRIDYTGGTPILNTDGIGETVGVNGFANYSCIYGSTKTINVFNEGNNYIQANSYCLTILDGILKFEKNNI